MGWDCPRCAAENPLGSNRCLSCGYQYFPGYDSVAPGRASSGPLSDSVEKQRQTIQDEIRKGLEDARQRSKAALERLAGEPPGPPSTKDG